MATLLNAGSNLEKSWEIDVEAELDTYLQQLEKNETVAEVDEKDSPKCNFIEAAFLLQSGTSVYGRKVEYLRTLAYQTLQNLSSHLGQEGASGTTVSKTGIKKSVRPQDTESSGLMYVPWDLLEKAECSDNSITEKVQSNQTVTYLLNLEDPSKDIKFPARSSPSFNPSLLSSFSKLLNPRDGRAETCIESSTFHPTLGFLIVDHEDLYNFNLNKEPVCAGNELYTTTPQVNRYNVTPFYDANLHEAQATIGDVGGGSSIFGSRPAGEFVRPLDTAHSDFERSFESDIGNDVESVGNVDKNEAQAEKEAGSNSLEFLDCNKLIGRDRPMVVGDPTRPPLVPDDVLNNVEDVDLEQMFVLYCLSKENKMYADTVLRWGVDPLPEHLLDEESRAKRNQAILDYMEKNKKNPKLTFLHEQKHFLYKFPKIELPKCPLMDYWGFGSTYINVEEHFAKLMQKKAEETKDIKKARLDEAATKAYEETPIKTVDTQAETGKSVNLKDPFLDNIDASDMEMFPTLQEEENLDLVQPQNASNLSSDNIENVMLENLNELEQKLAEGENQAVLEASKLLSSVEFDDTKMNTIDTQQALMHARLIKWRSKVDEWTKAINSRGLYDVAIYKEKIYSRMNSKNTVSFNELIECQDRSCVCRTFLTTLMMCYDATVEMKSLKVSQDGIVDNFDLVLIKRSNSNSSWNKETKPPKTRKKQ